MTGLLFCVTRFIEEGIKRQREGAAKIGGSKGRGKHNGGNGSEDGGGVAGEAFKALRSRALAGARSTLLASIQADLDRKRLVFMINCRLILYIFSSC